MRLNIFKSLFGLCVATAAVSCSNDQFVEDLVCGKDSDIISFVVADDNTRGGSFGNRQGLSTRSTVTTMEGMYESAFSVYGDMTKLDFSNSICLFNNEPVSYSNGEWIYSNRRYWFEDYEYSFLAIHPSSVIPAENGSTNGELSKFEYKDGTMSFNYTLPSDYSKATDILIAGHRRRHTAETQVKTVELNFGHIMSRLNFVAKIDPSAKNAGIKIKEITITGVASKASYSVLPANIQPGYSETSDFSEAKWTVSSTPERISINKATDDSNIETTIDNESGITSISLFPSSDPFFIIPQTVTNDMYVTLTYSRTGKEDVTIEGRLRPAALTHSYIWTSGNSYTYTFTLGIDDYIIFDKPKIDPWNEDQGGNYIVVG